MVVKKDNFVLPGRSQIVLKEGVFYFTGLVGCCTALRMRKSVSDTTVLSASNEVPSPTTSPTLPNLPTTTVNMSVNNALRNNTTQNTSNTTQLSRNSSPQVNSLGKTFSSSFLSFQSIRNGQGCVKKVAKTTSIV